MRAALARRVEARAAAVRARIAGALEAEGVAAQVAGETVRLTAPGCQITNSSSRGIPGLD